jgi:hypothetical protein
VNPPQSHLPWLWIDLALFVLITGAMIRWRHWVATHQIAMWPIVCADAGAFFVSHLHKDPSSMDTVLSGVLLLLFVLVLGGRIKLAFDKRREPSSDRAPGA